MVVALASGFCVDKNRRSQWRETSLGVLVRDLLSSSESDANINTVECECDLLKRLQPRSSTAGSTAGTESESPRRKLTGVPSIIFRMANRVPIDRERLPSDQRHTSSSFEQQVPKLRSKLSNL